MNDYYSILNIPRNASGADIKKAYRSLVRKYHPDVSQYDKATAEKKFREITEAYDVLSDPEQKRRYDDSLERKQAAKDIPPPSSERRKSSAQSYSSSPSSSYGEVYKSDRMWVPYSTDWKKPTEGELLKEFGCLGPLLLVVMLIIFPIWVVSKGYGFSKGILPHIFVLIVWFTVVNKIRR